MVSDSGLYPTAKACWSLTGSFWHRFRTSCHRAVNIQCLVPQLYRSIIHIISIFPFYSLPYEDLLGFTIEQWSSQWIESNWTEGQAKWKKQPLITVACCVSQGWLITSYRYPGFHFPSGDPTGKQKVWPSFAYNPNGRVAELQLKMTFLRISGVRAQPLGDPHLCIFTSWVFVAGAGTHL